jgi:hypothetical protein
MSDHKQQASDARLTTAEAAEAAPANQPVTFKEFLET